MTESPWRWQHGPAYHLCPICGAYVQSMDVAQPDLTDADLRSGRLVRYSPPTTVFVGHPCDHAWTGECTIDAVMLTVIWHSAHRTSYRPPIRRNTSARIRRRRKPATNSNHP